MKTSSFLRKISPAVCAVSLFICSPLLAGNAPESASETRKKIAAELDQAATGMAPNTGKMAVVKRLAALFRGSSNPIISTRKYVPAKPYISMHDIISKDPLVPARTLIIYRLRFMQADSKTLDAVEGIVGEDGTVEISEKQNTVVINVLKNRAESVKNALIALDQPVPQILVETQVVEILVENGEERDVQLQYTQKDGKTGTVDTYGFNLSSSGQDANAGQDSGFNFFPIAKIDGHGGYKQLHAALKWLSTSTDSKILASPNLIAELGTEAKMTTGEEIPYAEAAVTNTAVSQNIKFKKTGINLTIKPVIINQDTVKLEIKPEIILAVRYQTFVADKSSSTVPVVSIRNISTTLTAADGEIIMLGGLYSSEVTEQLRKIPFLSDIPIIGELFTAKNKSIHDKQLLFFMKIHILKSPYSVMLDPEHNAAVIQDMGQSLRDSGTLFPQKPEPKLLDHFNFFSLKSLWDPEPFWPEKKGNESGEEKRPPVRKLKEKTPVKQDAAAPKDAPAGKKTPQSPKDSAAKKG